MTSHALSALDVHEHPMARLTVTLTGGRQMDGIYYNNLK